MPVTTAMTNSFKRELLAMDTHVAADVYRYVLIRAGHVGTYDASTTNAGTPGSGTPGTANLGTDAVAVSGDYNSVNGITLAGLAATLLGSTGCLTFTDPAPLTGTTISADGMLIYNSTRANRVCGVFAFASAPRTSTGGPFDVNLPVADAANALLRIA